MIIEFYFKADQNLTEADIMAFEGRIGKTLPEDYKQHMLLYNGGSVINKNIEHINYPEEIDTGLDYLFSIKYGSNTVKDNYDSISQFLDVGYLPIGKNNGGGYIIISLNNDNSYGKIKEWYPDDELNYMSPSFIQYLEDMTESEDF